MTITPTNIIGLTELSALSGPTYPNSSDKIVNTSYLSNYVNITTAQSIARAKNFSI